MALSRSPSVGRRRRLTFRISSSSLLIVSPASSLARFSALSSASNAAIRLCPTEAAAAKQALRLLKLAETGSGSAADAAVRDSYHAGLVAPFCLREARNLFDAAATK